MERFVEEERRCNTRGGKASESLSEENCPLEALGVFSFLGIPTGKPPRGPLRGSGIFSGFGLVVPLRRCTSVSLRIWRHGHWNARPLDRRAFGEGDTGWHLPCFLHVQSRYINT